MFMGKDCLFCKIIRGEIPSAKIYEDEHSFAFLDINPVNPGHTLLVPKRHFTNLYETSDEILKELAPTIKKLAIAVKKAVSADGINIGMNNDSAAGQLIFHAHFHIIPRRAEDGFKHWRSKRAYKDDEMNMLAKKIKASL